MSADGGQVVVQLLMEDGQYRVATLNAGVLMRELKRSIDSTAVSVKKLEGQSASMGRRFRDLVLTLGNLRFVLMNINDIFLRLPVAILRSAGEIEKMQALMTGLSNETSRARKEAEGLSNFNYTIGVAKNAPFELKALADSFVKLKSAGIDPTNGSMQALVDSVARFGGTSEQLKRASVAIQQMSGKGVISMEELRQQLGEAVPTAMRSMAEGLGMTMANLAKTVSTGTLEAGPAISRMLARMAVENDQAAQEMMKTWVGMLSLLGTEWQLTTKLIADSGLGVEAKKAVSELTAGLQSGEFRQFAASVGQVMGDTVQQFVSAVKWVVKYREEIGLLIKGYIAYKAATTLYLPALSAINTARERAIDLVRRESGSNGAVARLMEQRGAQIQLAQAVVASTAAQRAETVKFIAGKEAELAAVRARNAAILASDRALAAQMAFIGGVRIEGRSGFQSRAAGIAELARLSAANSAQIAQERALTAEIAAKKVALDLTSASLARHTAALGAMTYATRAQALASVVMTNTMRAGGAVFNLMGGWVGIAITALVALIYVYNKLTGAAKEASDAMRRQKQEASTDEDLATAEKQLAAKRKELELAEFSVNNKKGNATGRGKSAEEIALDASNLAKVKGEVAALEANLEKRALIIRERAAAEEATSMTSTTRRLVETRKDATGQIVKSIVDEKESKLKALKENSPEWLKVRNEYIAKEQAAFKDGRLKLAAELQANAESDEANAQRARGMTQAQRDAMLVAARDKRTQAEAIRQELSNFDAGMPTFKPPKADKADKADKAGEIAPESAIQRMVESLRESRAQLTAEIAGFDQTADKVSGVIAKVWAQYKNGDFDDKKTGKRPGVAEISNLLQSATDEQNLKNKLKSLEENAAGVQRVTDYINGMRDEVEEAMELLADPLGMATKGSRARQVEKYIAKSADDLAAMAEKMGVTVRKIVADMRSDANKVDDSKRFAQVAQETERLNESMVTDSRQAARKRAEIEDARHTKVMQNIIDARKAMNEPTAELEKILQESTAARGAARAKEFESPLEKLAASWANTTKNMEDASVGWANGTSQAITDLVMTGKADFAGLARSIIADLVRIQVQKAASSAVAAAASFFFADGGIMSSQGSVPLKKYAAGGIADSPQMAIFGEGSMKEAYVPLPDGRSIPVTMKGQGGGGNVEINITVHKNGSESNSSKGDDSSQYKQLGERVKQVVREEIQNQSRPGGLLYN
jgi:tape measure domain-containing protein